MNKTYNWGILAPGNIAGKFVSELKSVANARVLAVGSRELSKAKSFANTYGIERSYGSYLELATDPDLDIIYVASPHAFHAEHSIFCLRNKKAVLCEKAFALNSLQVSEMIRTAHEEGAFLMEAFFTPHQPSYQEARNILKSGLLGEIKHLHGWFGFNKFPYDPNGRLYNPELGGGALLDIGLYPIFDALWFIGMPLETFAFADIAAQNIDQSVTAMFKFEGNITATIFASFISAVGVGTDIFCEKGVLRLRRISALNQSLEIQIPGEPIKILNWDESSCGLKMEAVHAMKCLENRKLESDIMSHQDSLNLMNLLDDIRKIVGL